MKKRLKSSPKLSIIIVSFNTKKLLRECLLSLERVRGEVSFEVIVSDNGSEDGSVDMVKNFSWVKLIENRQNLGFAKGNNVAREVASGEYILFLNSDTRVFKNTLKESTTYLAKHKDVGSLTCKIVLPNGRLDRDTRRRFPTPMIAAKRLFLGLPRDYWYLDVNPEKTHEVEVVQGAFHLTRKKVLDKVDWFDEDYFLDGEDVDLCWKIKQLGYKIIYYPKVSITHVKRASKRFNRNSLTVTSGIKAMEIFYRKRLWNKYPFYINYLVLFGIKILLLVRLTKFKLLSFRA
jgi:hypothetical protein